MATYLRDLEAVIDAEIEALQSQLDETPEMPREREERKEPKPFNPGDEPKLFSLAGRDPDSDDDDTPAIEKKRPRSRAALEVRPLSARIYRLDQLRRWMKDDPDLFHILDITIGNQVKAAQEQQQQLAKAAERRQRIFSIIGGIATLIVGWLLSLVGTPATLFGR